LVTHELAHVFLEHPIIKQLDNYDNDEFANSEKEADDLVKGWDFEKELSKLYRAYKKCKILDK